MENNEGIRDNNSDSENSEWAVIDEDASLEWNDEAKYHFRSTHDKSATKETSLTRVQSPALSGNTSDEDSIEVVSDVANDHHITDDVGNFESQDDEENTADEVKSPDIRLRDGNEMVWYRLGERNAVADHRNNVISVRAKKNKQNALNLSDNWDLVAILIVALIGGYAVGYFCGSQRNEVAPSRLLVNKLQCAVANMRWHQNRLCRASSALGASTTCRITHKRFNNATSRGSVQSLDSIESERKLEGDGPMLATDPRLTQVKPDALLASQDSDEIEEGFADGFVDNIDVPLLAALDQLGQQMELDEYAEEDLGEGIAPEIVVSDPLREAIEKISHLLAVNEKFPNFDGLTSNVEFLKKVDFSVEVLDSILKTVPLKQTNKVTNYRQDVEKGSKKLLRRIDKSVTRFAKHLYNKLDESKSVLLKKLCKHWSVTVNENHFASIKLANTVFEECGHIKPRHADVVHEAPEAKNTKHKSKPPTNKVAQEPLVRDKEVKSTVDVTQRKKEAQEALKPTEEVKQRKKEAHKAVKPTEEVKQRKKEAHKTVKPTEDMKHQKKSGEKTRSKRDAPRSLNDGSVNGGFNNEYDIKDRNLPAKTKIIHSQEKRCTGKKADCNREPQEVKQNTASGNQHQSGKQDLKKIPHKETPLPDNYKKVDKKKSNIGKKEPVISKTIEGHKESPLPEKSVKDKQMCGGETSEDNAPRSPNDGSVSSGFNNEYDMEDMYLLATVIGKGNERETDYHSAAAKAARKADSVVAADNGTSTVSGEWVLRMGNSRAKQRHNDHQSDWLFERAQSRKCHRGNKDCKASLYTKHDPTEYSSEEGGNSRKERKHWLKNAIPKRIVEAAKTAKNAFNELRHNLKERVRF